jgi:DNA polymerase-3 subunit delta'
MPFKSDHALQLLGRARDNGRLGHAYLITGPKEARHEEFAAKVLDLVVGMPQRTLEGWEGQGAVVLRPQSKSRRITIGDDGDDPGTIRFLEKMIRRTAAPNGWKLGVIVDAERMNVQAQNAFLKTLEEPPPRTLLLLLTTQPEQLLPTIQSRVIEVGLMPPAGARIFTEHENKLLIVLGKHASRGSGTLSGALALKVEFEEILEELHEDLKKKHEDEFERETEHYGKTTDGSWLKQREDQVEAAIEADYIQQRSALMDLLLAWFGDVARQQAGAEHLDLPKHQSLTATLATKWEPADVAKRVRILRQLESHLHTNVNESLALEVCFIQAFGI